MEKHQERILLSSSSSSSFSSSSMIDRPFFHQDPQNVREIDSNWGLIEEVLRDAEIPLSFFPREKIEKAEFKACYQSLVILYFLYTLVKDHSCEFVVLHPVDVAITQYMSSEDPLSCLIKAGSVVIAPSSSSSVGQGEEKKKKEIERGQRQDETGETEIRKKKMMVARREQERVSGEEKEKEEEERRENEEEEKKMKERGGREEEERAGEGEDSLFSLLSPDELLSQIYPADRKFLYNPFMKAALAKENRSLLEEFQERKEEKEKEEKNTRNKKISLTTATPLTPRGRKGLLQQQEASLSSSSFSLSLQGKKNALSSSSLSTPRSSQRERNVKYLPESRRPSPSFLLHSQEKALSASVRSSSSPSVSKGEDLSSSEKINKNGNSYPEKKKKKEGEEDEEEEIERPSFLQKKNEDDPLLHIPFHPYRGEEEEDDEDEEKFEKMETRRLKKSDKKRHEKHHRGDDLPCKPRMEIRRDKKQRSSFSSSSSFSSPRSCSDIVSPSSDIPSSPSFSSLSSSHILRRVSPSTAALVSAGRKMLREKKKRRESQERRGEETSLPKRVIGGVFQADGSFVPASEEEERRKEAEEEEEEGDTSALEEEDKEHNGQERRREKTFFSSSSSSSPACRGSFHDRDRLERGLKRCTSQTRDRNEKDSLSQTRRRRSFSLSHEAGSSRQDRKKEKKDSQERDTRRRGRKATDKKGMKASSSSSAGDPTEEEEEYGCIMDHQKFNRRRKGRRKKREDEGGEGRGFLPHRSRREKEEEDEDNSSSSSAVEKSSLSSTPSSRRRRRRHRRISSSSSPPPPRPPSLMKMDACIQTLPDDVGHADPFLLSSSNATLLSSSFPPILSKDGDENARQTRERKEAEELTMKNEKRWGLDWGGNESHRVKGEKMIGALRYQLNLLTEQLACSKEEVRAVRRQYEARLAAEEEKHKMELQREKETYHLQLLDLQAKHASALQTVRKQMEIKVRQLEDDVSLDIEVLASSSTTTTRATLTTTSGSERAREEERRRRKTREEEDEEMESEGEEDEKEEMCLKEKEKSHMTQKEDEEVDKKKKKDKRKKEEEDFFLAENSAVLRKVQHLQNLMEERLRIRDTSLKEYHLQIQDIQHDLATFRQSSDTFWRNWQCLNRFKESIVFLARQGQPHSTSTAATTASIDDDEGGAAGGVSSSFSTGEASMDIDTKKKKISSEREGEEIDSPSSSTENEKPRQKKKDGDDSGKRDVSLKDGEEEKGGSKKSEKKRDGDEREDDRKEKMDDKISRYLSSQTRNLSSDGALKDLRSTRGLTVHEQLNTLRSAFGRDVLHLLELETGWYVPLHPEKEGDRRTRRRRGESHFSEEDEKDANRSQGGGYDESRLFSPASRCRDLSARNRLDRRDHRYHRGAFKTSSSSTSAYIASQFEYKLLESIIEVSCLLHVHTLQSAQQELDLHRKIHLLQEYYEGIHQKKPRDITPAYPPTTTHTTTPEKGLLPKQNEKDEKDFSEKGLLQTGGPRGYEKQQQRKEEEEEGEKKKDNSSSSSPLKTNSHRLEAEGREASTRGAGGEGGEGVSSILSAAGAGGASMPRGGVGTLVGRTRGEPRSSATVDELACEVFGGGSSLEREIELTEEVRRISLQNLRLQRTNAYLRRKVEHTLKWRENDLAFEKEKANLSRSFWLAWNSLTSQEKKARPSQERQQTEREGETSKEEEKEKSEGCRIRKKMIKITEIGCSPQNKGSIDSNPVKEETGKGRSRRDKEEDEKKKEERDDNEEEEVKRKDLSSSSFSFFWVPSFVTLPDTPGEEEEIERDATLLSLLKSLGRAPLEEEEEEDEEEEEKTRRRRKKKKEEDERKGGYIRVHEDTRRQLLHFFWSMLQDAYKYRARLGECRVQLVRLHSFISKSTEIY
ncbi:calponin homology domain-containing, partial [Cystoisospora suis]